MSVVGCTMEAIAQQEDEHSQLEKSLEEQHVRSTFIHSFMNGETIKK